MHLVGCTRKPPPIPNEWTNIRVAAPAVSFPFQEDPDTRHAPPLNSSTPEDCAIEVTVQYPPLHCRWNRDRAVKYSIHSKREKDDPPLEEVDKFATVFAMVLQTLRNILQQFCNVFYIDLQRT
jgi:hypothetical protein